MLYQILSRTRNALSTLLEVSSETDAVCDRNSVPDPLGHPDVQRMSLRDLADLPIEPFCLPVVREGRRSASPATDRPEMAAKACICAVAPL
tara:strand:- start:5253 stop:5525 length:273 start_codon:yes stop_codon:yes gene_type:complete